MITEAPIGAKLFDTVCPVSEGMAQVAKSRGFDGCVRYVTMITSAEVQIIHEAGLGLLLVTACRGAGWHPDKNMGAIDGAAHSLAIVKLGLSGITIFHDIEGVAPDTDPNDLCEMHDAWASKQEGEPGVYVGAGALLSGSEWYRRPYTKHYWKGLSDVHDRYGQLVEPTCGWGMIQCYDDTRPGYQANLLGVDIDISFIERDYKLRLPRWYAP